MHYLLLCNKISKKNLKIVAYNHILLFLMILWSGWALLGSSSGACGTDQVTHVDHSAEKPGRGCVYMMASFARLVLQGG